MEIKPRTPSDLQTVAGVFDRYLDRLSNEHAACFDSARRFLSKIAKKIGAEKVEGFRPGALLAAIDSVKTWGPSTRRTVLAYVRAAFAYDRRMLEIPFNPVKDAFIPKSYRARSRGREAYLPKPVGDVLVSQAGPGLSWFLTALRATGARPRELWDARLFNWHPDLKAIVYRANAPEGYRGKNADRRVKGDPDRYIFFPDDLAEELSARKRRGERLFPTARGHAWTGKSLDCRMTFLRRKPAVREVCQANGVDPDSVVPYAFRHTFITDKLLSGVEIAIVAAACDTSVATIQLHYAHLFAQPAKLRAAIFGK